MRGALIIVVSWSIALRTLLSFLMLRRATTTTTIGMVLSLWFAMPVNVLTGCKLRHLGPCFLWLCPQMLRCCRVSFSALGNLGCSFYALGI